MSLTATTTAAYAGIGSRRSPHTVLAYFEHLARIMRASGWTLRSGHAPGADQAFERGAADSAEVYLPWRGFERTVPLAARTVKQTPTAAAYELAERFHPRWTALSRGARALHARNCHQILGADLETPALLVICWTPDGSSDGTGPDSAGTGQALRIASAHSVPVLNIRNREDLKRASRVAVHLHAFAS